MKSKRILIYITSIICLITLIILVNTYIERKKIIEQVSLENSKARVYYPIELTLWHPNSASVNYNSYILKAFETKIGANIRFMTLPSNDKEYYNLRIASGEIPDIFCNLSFSEYYNYIDKGILAIVPISLLDKYSPNLIKYFEKYSNSDSLWKYYLRNGRNYSVPSLLSTQTQNVGMVCRRDWLDELGIETENKKIDLEEFENILSILKREKNIYPLSGAGLGDFSFVFGAFDVYPMIFTYKKISTGSEEEIDVLRLVRGEVEPNAKKALEVLNRWYKKGYIDPHFIINKKDNLQEKWVRGKCALLQHDWKDFLHDGIFSEDVLNDIDNIGIMQFPYGPNSEWGTIQDPPMMTGVQFGKQLNRKNDKLIKYLQLFNLAYSEKAIQLLYKGVENYTYEYMEQSEEYRFIGAFKSKQRRDEFGIGLPLLASFNNTNLHSKYGTLSKIEGEHINDKIDTIGRYDILSPVYKPIYTMYNDKLTEIVEKNFIKFIIGERPLDEFGDFVDEWYKSGGMQIMDEAHDKYNSLNE